MATALTNSVICIKNMITINLCGILYRSSNSRTCSTHALNCICKMCIFLEYYSTCTINTILNIHLYQKQFRFSTLVYSFLSTCVRTSGEELLEKNFWRRTSKKKKILVFWKLIKRPISMQFASVDVCAFSLTISA